jgi:hypothetical protein
VNDLYRSDYGFIGEVTIDSCYKTDKELFDKYLIESGIQFKKYLLDLFPEIDIKRKENCFNYIMDKKLFGYNIISGGPAIMNEAVFTDLLNTGVFK